MHSKPPRVTLAKSGAVQISMNLALSQLIDQVRRRVAPAGSLPTPPMTESIDSLIQEFPDMLRFSILSLTRLLPLGFVACLLVDTPSRLPTPAWTPEQASHHADLYNDPEEWNLEVLEIDLEVMGTPLDPELEPLPFPYLAFPVPEYDLCGRTMHGLGVAPVPTSEPVTIQACSANQPLDEDAIPEGKTWWDVIITEPIMHVIARGPEPFETAGPWAVSRSHPHYFFQGTMHNVYGEVDWVGIRMGDGKEIGIVNGRILDLEQGNVIFVLQKEDGSIRIRQHRERSQPGRFAEVHGPVQRLLEEEEVREFLEL